MTVRWLATGAAWRGRDTRCGYKHHDHTASRAGERKAASRLARASREQTATVPGAFSMSGSALALLASGRLCKPLRPGALCPRCRLLIAWEVAREQSDANLEILFCWSSLKSSKSFISLRITRLRQLSALVVLGRFRLCAGALVFSAASALRAHSKTFQHVRISSSVARSSQSIPAAQWRQLPRL